MRIGPPQAMSCGDTGPTAAMQLEQPTTKAAERPPTHLIPSGAEPIRDWFGADQDQRLGFDHVPVGAGRPGGVSTNDPEAHAVSHGEVQAVRDDGNGGQDAGRLKLHS